MQLVHVGRVASVLVSEDFPTALVKVAEHEDQILPSTNAFNHQVSTQVNLPQLVAGP